MSDFSSKALKSNNFITRAVLLNPTSSRAVHDSFFLVSHSLLNELGQDALSSSRSESRTRLSRLACSTSASSWLTCWIRLRTLYICWLYWTSRLRNSAFSSASWIASPVTSGASDWRMTSLAMVFDRTMSSCKTFEFLTHELMSSFVSSFMVCTSA